ncbi:hypothetical protein RFN66_12210 [Bacillus paralicheniformis]|uniref:hypothetical protein n=1 Tax=Bacillus paralicheniformis TaxID=1648923 RepID=UPI0028681E1B|nr:hypothetical protein [Bacillus paralicheniformis]WMW45498.1 hypothetical protein RFN66_12210 [Bacillus paralicheniformis]
MAMIESDFEVKERKTKETGFEFHEKSDTDINRETGNKKIDIYKNISLKWRVLGHKTSAIMSLLCVFFILRRDQSSFYNCQDH